MIFVRLLDDDAPCSMFDESAALGPTVSGPLCSTLTGLSHSRVCYHCSDLSCVWRQAGRTRSIGGHVLCTWAQSNTAGGMLLLKLVPQWGLGCCKNLSLLASSQPYSCCGQSLENFPPTASCKQALVRTYTPDIQASKQGMSSIAYAPFYLGSSNPHPTDDRPRMSYNTATISTAKIVKNQTAGPPQI